MNMMDGINEYFLTVIGAALICGMITLLSPKGNFQKSFALISGVFVLFCMVTPLTNGFETLENFDFSIDLDESNMEQNDVWQYSANAMEQVLIAQIDECVKKITSESAIKIEVEITSTDSGFVLSSAVIWVSNEYKDKLIAIRDYVKMETGVIPEVIT